MMKKYAAIPALLVALCAVFGGCQPARVRDPEQLYAAAVRDAMTVEAEEVLPVVALTPESGMAEFDDQGRVLLLSWHRHPDRYPAGEAAALSWGEVWTFTSAEILSWYDRSGGGVTDWELRLEQLIGLPPEAGYTHFSAFWVELEDLFRPAYVWEVTRSDMTASFEETPPEDFKAWFDGNIVWSYFDSAYPWTRLGYTYDWSGEGEYGLSEFIIRAGSEVEVAFTLTTGEFLLWLAEN